MSGAVKTTAITLVHERLRSDIIDCVLLPGAKLQIEEMAERYGIGVNPVREALNRLSTEGFVEHRDQRGFFVRPVSLREFREMIHARCWLECRALEESIRQRNAEWEDALVLAHFRMARQGAAHVGQPYNRDPAWEGLHGDFHTALLANANNDWLLRYCQDLQEQTARYRFLADGNSESQRNTPDEHRFIMEATLDGDVAKATALLAEHFQLTLQLLEQRFTGKDEVIVGGIHVPRA